MFLLCFNACFTTILAYTYRDEQILTHTLFANYLPAIRPVDQQSQATAVQADFRLLEILSFDDRKGVLKTISILTITWLDEKIRSNKSVYDIGHIYVSPSSVWRPRIFLTNPASEQLQIESQNKADDRVQYQSDGRAIYTYNGQTTTRCDAIILYFPFDKHVCELKFVSYESTSRVFLVAQTLGFVVPQSRNKEWEVLTVTISQFEIRVASGVNQSNVMTTFKFQRKPGFDILNMFLPIPCFGFINILVFLHVLPVIEWTFSVTIVLTLVFFLNLVGESLPPVSDPISIFNVIIMTQLLNSFFIVISTLFTLVAFEGGQKDINVQQSVRRVVSVMNEIVPKRNKVYSDTIPKGQKEEDADSVKESHDESKDQETVPSDRHPTWNVVSEVTNKFYFWLFLLLFIVECSVYLILMIFYWCNTPLL